MKRNAALVVLLGGIVALAAAVRAWMQERQRREVFPAANAAALLNPLRRLIQSAEGTVRAFGLKPGDVALEIGPGPGYFTPHAAAAIQPGGRLVCLDVQREMLAILRNNMRDSAANVDLVVGSAERLPFRTGAIDAAFLISVLGEVPDEHAAVAEIARLLSPGGTASFCETVNDPDYVRLPVMRKMCAAAAR